MAGAAICAKRCLTGTSGEEWLYVTICVCKISLQTFRFFSSIAVNDYTRGSS